MKEDKDVYSTLRALCDQVKKTKNKKLKKSLILFLDEFNIYMDGFGVFADLSDAIGSVENIYESINEDIKYPNRFKGSGSRLVRKKE